MILRLILALVLAACILPAPLAAQKAKRAKNVILLLADAGGVATVNAASIVGYNAPQKLFVQSWPHVALMDTSTASQWVSDSAAGMTAIVTGVKTHNGVISQGPDAVRGKQDGTPLKTILEYAEERGLSTGVLSDVTITDATPAACFAHTNNRRNFGEIFLELFSPRYGDGVDVLIGPGRKRIYEAVKALGKDPEAVAAAQKRPVYASLADWPETAKRGLVIANEDIDLAAAAKRALRVLSQNPRGYFLMIESDAHTDDPERGLGRLVAFDKLIREIAGMTNPAETLLIFTADHSFDLRIAGGGPDQPLLKGWEEWKNSGRAKSDSIRLPYLRVDDDHTGEEVPVMARGPGAEAVSGFMANTRLFEIMLEAYGWPKSAGKK